MAYVDSPLARSGYESQLMNAAAAKGHADAIKARRQRALPPPPPAARSLSSRLMVAAVSTWFTTMWLLAAAVAAMAVGGAALTSVLATAALTELCLALASSVAIAVMLLSRRTAEPVREAVGGAAVLWGLVAAPFVLLGFGAFLLVVIPPHLEGSHLERIGPVIRDAGTLGMAAVCCFVVIPASLLTILRRARALFEAYPAFSPSN